MCVTEGDLSIDVDVILGICTIIPFVKDQPPPIVLF